MTTVVHETTAAPAAGTTGSAPQGVAGVLAPLVGRLDARAPGGRAFGLRFWDGSELPATTERDSAPVLIVRHPDALTRILRAPGELGFARAWVSGELDVEGDLEAALDRTERYRHLQLVAGDALPAIRAVRRLGLLRRAEPEPPACEARLTGDRHSTERDRQAVTHHYDVSNAFYERMLGPTMVYSCAYFGSPDESLDDAQTRKLDLVCRKLDLQPGERLLDIGCGWGSLLMHAAREYGVHAVGVTISDAQAKLARERIRANGLSDRCEVRLQDYREVDDGPYDKIASIGMFEHVGEGNLAVYFARARALLAPGGLFLNHGIVRPQPVPGGVGAFTTRYVFPDGELHSQGSVISALEKAGFEVRDDESLRPHYAQTLREWAKNHDAHRDLATAELGTERERVWRLHNHGAALGFARGSLSIHQALAAPAESPWPPLRVRAYEPKATTGIEPV